jgi:hypothetical protein
MLLGHRDQNLNCLNNYIEFNLENKKHQMATWWERGVEEGHKENTKQKKYGPGL